MDIRYDWSPGREDAELLARADRDYVRDHGEPVEPEIDLGTWRYDGNNRWSFVGDSGTVYETIVRPEDWEHDAPDGPDVLRCPSCGEPVWDKPNASKLAKCWRTHPETGGTLAFDTMSDE